MPDIYFLVSAFVQKWRKVEGKLSMISSCVFSLSDVTQTRNHTTGCPASFPIVRPCPRPVEDRTSAKMSNRPTRIVFQQRQQNNLSGTPDGGALVRPRADSERSFVEWCVRRGPAALLTTRCACRAGDRRRPTAASCANVGEDPRHERDLCDLWRRGNGGHRGVRSQTRRLRFSIRVEIDW